VIATVSCAERLQGNTAQSLQDCRNELQTVESLLVNSSPASSFAFAMDVRMGSLANRIY
jgi:hypothetical protein